jgi:hypothetical protein
MAFAGNIGADVTTLPGGPGLSDVVKLYSANFDVVIERNGGIDGLIRALAERNLRNTGVVVAKPVTETAD